MCSSKFTILNYTLKDVSEDNTNNIKIIIDLLNTLEYKIRNHGKNWFGYIHKLTIIKIEFSRTTPSSNFYNNKYEDKSSYLLCKKLKIKFIQCN